jgi:phenylalanyl-tRNA synthetase beta chain
VQALASRLTMLGLEVESVTVVGERSPGLVIGRVLESKRHSGADRLSVCSVDVGTGEALSIVCGASNVRAGGVYVVALPGARLPGGTTITATKVRGEPSAGMLCSARELGLTETSEGLLELDGILTPGQDANGLLHLGDHVIDLNVTPNRADCFSIAGIAREVAAPVAARVRMPDFSPIPGRVGDRVPVTVHGPADCPRFAGRVIRGLRPAARTPLWMSERLRRCGLRPVHPIVDVTNYVMLEIGQPMHAYDLSGLTGGIRVRRAEQGQTVTLLNGQLISLDPEMLIIADDSGPIGLAGIMGGRATAVKEDSRDVFLESAFFSPAAVGGRSRRLGLNTDASVRFERGVDPSIQVPAIERATRLILEIAGGEPGPVTDLSSLVHIPVRRPVRLRRERLTRVLGVEVPAQDVGNILARLGMKVEMEALGWVATPPPARFDLEREEDLIEEVARVFGYERIPEIAARSETHLARASEEPDLPAAIRSTLIARGFQEAITYSFIDPVLDRRFGAVESAGLALSNPISADMAVMRQSLWPGLVQAARENLHRQQRRARFFELGTRFVVNSESTCREEPSIAAVIIGDRLPEQWAAKPEKVDVFDLKADLNAVLSLAGPGLEVRFEPAAHPALHPGRAASVVIGDMPVGWIGELHPALASELGIPNAVLFEVPVAAVTGKPPAAYRTTSRLPAIRRDLAVVVPREVQGATLLGLVRRAAPVVLQDAFIFDIYAGPQIAATEKSVAIGLILQDTSRTLTDADADRIVQRVRKALAGELSATFRE